MWFDIPMHCERIPSIELIITFIISHIYLLISPHPLNYIILALMIEIILIAISLIT